MAPPADDEDLTAQNRKAKRWGSIAGLILIICFIISLILVSFSNYYLSGTNENEIFIVLLANERISIPANERFLSVALDTEVIANGFQNFNMTDPKLLKLIGALSPAYLRVGGNLADRLEFVDDKRVKYPYTVDYRVKGKGFRDYPNFTMDAFVLSALFSLKILEHEWLSLNKLAKTTGLELIFDLNSMRRFDNGSWDYQNAEKLMKFSQAHNLLLNWELGNEPNSYRHKFNYVVEPETLANDFKTLKHVLSKYPNYKKSMIFGPSVTRPRANHPDSELFLKKFLENNGSDPVDAITWHQYYFDGRTARCSDFLNPFIFDILKWQVLTVRSIVDTATTDVKPIWLGETSSAYGGGAPGYSDRFIATFIWLDKLGIAALYGVNLVVRQSLFHGSYALIGDDYTPAPDWWISVMYKKLVGRQVLPCQHSISLKTRVYCHCNNSTATVFGMNLSKYTARIQIQGSKSKTGHAYVLTTTSSLNSRNIFLNDKLLVVDANGDAPDFRPKIVKLLPFIEFPAYSLFFITIHDQMICMPPFSQ